MPNGEWVMLLDQAFVFPVLALSGLSLFWVSSLLWECSLLCTVSSFILEEGNKNDK